jgi:hypothetical protein
MRPVMNGYDGLTQRGEVWGLSFSPFDERPLFLDIRLIYHTPMSRKHYAVNLHTA